ncbi:MAG: hypothetical protein DRG24_01895 [Epsilonproteobacteria bacterium]|nr:MAG: hypothetical protein DRG24_01895 [Campylobacterota bacterium]
MKTIKHIVKTENISIAKDRSVMEAIDIMYQNDEGTVVLVDYGEVVGILTERDIVELLDSHVDMQQPVIDIGKKDVVSINVNRSPEYALHVLIDHNIRRLIIVNNDGAFLGLVTQELLMDKLEEEHFHVHLQVSHLMSSNKKNIITLAMQNTIADAVSKMHHHQIGALVLTDNAKIAGIITERDLVRIISKSIPMNTPLYEVMTKSVISVNIDDSVKDVVDLMRQNHIQRVLVNDSCGEAIGIVGMRDIIKSIKGNYGLFIENKLKYTKQAFNNIDEVIFEIYIDKTNTLIQWGNELALEKFGRKIIDRAIGTLIDDTVWSEVLNILFSEGSIHDYELKISHKLYMVSCNHFENSSSEQSFLLICKDATVYEKLQKEVDRQLAQVRVKDKQLLQQSRMAQMGEMISMIAHQWRQPLTAISATSTLIELKAKLNQLDNSVAQKGAKEISNYVQYLSHTIDDFRNFFQPNKEKQETTYDEIIKSVLGIIEISINSNNIQLYQKLNAHKRFVVYSNELQQVILNLIKNAEDVLLDKSIQNPYISIVTYEEGKSAILEVSDNGGGVPEDIMEKIFDPYFSTKGEKNGTGLGLYMSKTIIEEHCRGTLSVSRDDQGAVFKITI